MQEDFVQNKWKTDLNRLHANRGQGLNKLRTYWIFKSEYYTEDYVKNHAISMGNRRAMAQIRCSAAPIRIEVGRYDQGKYIPADQRICQICLDGVEDEKHVLLKCAFYDDLQRVLIDKACALNPDFMLYDDLDKFKYLMSNTEIVFYTAKTCRLILNRRKLFYYRMDK